MEKIVLFCEKSTKSAGVAKRQWRLVSNDRNEVETLRISPRTPFKTLRLDVCFRDKDGNNSIIILQTGPYELFAKIWDVRNNRFRILQIELSYAIMSTDRKIQQIHEKKNEPPIVFPVQSGVRSFYSEKAPIRQFVGQIPEKFGKALAFGKKMHYTEVISVSCGYFKFIVVYNQNLFAPELYTNWYVYGRGMHRVPI